MDELNKDNMLEWLKKEGYEIRPSVVTDAKELVSARADGFCEEVALYGKGPKATDSVENMVNYITNTEDHHFDYVMLAHGKIIARVRGYDEGQGKYYVKNLFVTLAYQGKGIGGKLLDYLDIIYPDAVLWHLETPYKSYRNHHFYERQGYVKVGETEPEEDGFYLFLYERRMQH